MTDTLLQVSCEPMKAMLSLGLQVQGGALCFRRLWRRRSLTLRSRSPQRWRRSARSLVLGVLLCVAPLMAAQFRSELPRDASSRQRLWVALFRQPDYRGDGLVLPNCSGHSCIAGKAEGFQAAGRCSEASPVTENRATNPAGAVDAPIAFLFAFECQGRRATDQHRCQHHVGKYSVVVGRGA